MTKKNIALIALTVVLAAIYVYYFTDFFRKGTIQIYSQIRPQITGKDQPPVFNVSFTLDQKYKLTSVKVVPAAEYQSNKYAHPVWSLMSDTTSEPVNNIVYGGKIPGMKPSIPKAQAEQLKANVAYLLIVEAGDVRGEKTFQTRAEINTTPQTRRH